MVRIANLADLKYILMSNNHLSNRLELADYSLSPRKVTKFLLGFIVLLIIGNIIEREIVQWLNLTNGSEIIPHYFNFDRESNFPSLYSALTLGFCSYLLYIIATVKKLRQAQFTNYWKALSYIFLYMAVDEACAIHELLIPIIREAINARGILYFAWVVPALFLLVIFLLIFRRFIQNLPAKTRNMFILAGAIYVGGAIGMEMVGGYIADTWGFNTFAYGMAARIEELLEMLGILIFINQLLVYLQSQTTNIHFSLSFRPLKSKSLSANKSEFTKK